MVRFKNRYITIGINNGENITCPLTITSPDLFSEIDRIVTVIHGDIGNASIRPGLHVRYCNELTKVGIIRVRHGPHKLVLSVLPLIRDIKGVSVTVELIYSGATLIHCYKALLKYQEKQLIEVLPLLNSDEKIYMQSQLLTLEKLGNSNDMRVKEEPTPQQPDI